MVILATPPGFRPQQFEAAIKATGLAVRQAVRKGDTVFSTKGSVHLEWTEEEL